MAKNSGIYKIKNGEKVYLSDTDVKKYIMNVQGWTESQYKREANTLRNKLRTFEAFKRRSGEDVTTQSPTRLLYFEARQKKIQGDEYRRSAELERIRSFPAYSTGKLQQVLGSEASLRTLSTRFEKTTNKSFEHFIEANDIAKQIVEKIADPVKREKALSDLAKKYVVHIIRDENGKEIGRVQNNQRVETGVTIGSGEAVDFNINSYL